MANNVFANGREIACKAGSGKTIAAFPDVCFTPPENPATPPGVPVPYPITSIDSDTNEGTRSVEISGKEAMQKDQSNFKKCSGDEAGCATKKGMITTTNKNTMYFRSWSCDVIIEGENACRHLDMTTSNHGSVWANEAVPFPFFDTSTIPADELVNELCPCCGTPVHSEAQARGQGMTAQQWYHPDYTAAGFPPTPTVIAASALYDQLAAQAAQRGCEGQFPNDDPNDPCTVHYLVDGDTAEEARGAWDMTNPTRVRNMNRSWLQRGYGAKAKKILTTGREKRERLAALRGPNIAHRTAITAGGCPLGPRNLTPTPPECADIEAALGRLQGQLTTYHRRANRLGGA